MALLFCDSFDDGHPNQSAKYDAVTVGDSGTDTGRTNSSWRARNAAFAEWNFPSNETLAYIGIAIQHSNPRQNNNFCYFMDGVSIQCYLQVDSTGVVRLLRGDGTVLATGAVVLSNSTFNTVEAMIGIGNSASYEIRITNAAGSSETLSGTADTQNTANAYSTSVQIGNNGNTSIYLDDFYIDDAQFLGPVKIYKLDPDGAGNSTQLTPTAGANWECVDENPHDSDTSYNASATSGHKDLYAMEASGITQGTIKGVVVNITAKKDDAASRSFYPVVRSNSTDYDGSSTALTTSYVTYQHILEDDPATSADWTVAAVDAMQAGIKVV